LPCMLEVFVDALFDSLKIMGFVFAFEVLLSFFEGKIVRLLQRSKRFAPALGSLCGVIPQCGVSIVAADMFSKKQLSLGTLVAVFLACSDEALPILFGNFTSSWWLTFLLIGLKIAIGTLVGVIVDLLCVKYRYKGSSEEGGKDSHYGCCGHEIEGEKEPIWKEHILHPIVHSLKIFAYCFVVSFAFGALVYAVGEDNIASFLKQNRAFSPLASTLVGLIPNCVSSVLLSQLFLNGVLPFGALLAGLLVNAGMGMFVLFKKKENIVPALLTLAICVVTGLSFGYLFLFALPSV
jgi:hypothetical protein